MANVNGANVDQLSAHSYADYKENDSLDYVPEVSYAKLLEKIYEVYCKEAKVVYNQFVTKIDYSGPIIRITTEGGHVYLAKKVISSIPLGVLKA